MIIIINLNHNHNKSCVDPLVLHGKTPSKTCMKLSFLVLLRVGVELFSTSYNSGIWTVYTVSVSLCHTAEVMGNENIFDRPGACPGSIPIHELVHHRSESSDRRGDR